MVAQIYFLLRETPHSDYLPDFCPYRRKPRALYEVVSDGEAELFILFLYRVKTFLQRMCSTQTSTICPHLVQTQSRP